MELWSHIYLLRIIKNLGNKGKIIMIKNCVNTIYVDVIEWVETIDSLCCK